MTSKLTLSGKDYGNEVVRSGFVLPTASSANFDTLITSVAAIKSAVNGITVGDYTGEALNAKDVAIGAKATLQDAQRERKWRVVYLDTVEPIGSGSVEIGMADSALLSTDSENMNTASGAGATFKTVFEANCVSRLGNPVTIQSVKLVGRTG